MDGFLVEGGDDPFAKAVALMEANCIVDNKGISSGVGCLALTFSAPIVGLGDDQQDDELLAGLQDDGNEEWDLSSGAAPMEVETENGNYMVQFSTADLQFRLMENVDRRCAFNVVFSVFIYF